MNRANFFKVIGGGCAAFFGIRPVVAKPLFDFKVRIIPGAVPCGGKMKIMRAIITKRRSDGMILGKAIQGYDTKEFHDEVERLKNDGVGEYIDSQVRELPEAWREAEMDYHVQPTEDYVELMIVPKEESDKWKGFNDNKA